MKEIKITLPNGGVKKVSSLARELAEEEDLKFYCPYTGQYEKAADFHKIMEVWALKRLRRGK